MKPVRTTLIAVLTAGVVGGTLALTLPDASAATSGIVLSIQPLTSTTSTLILRAPDVSTSKITVGPLSSGGFQLTSITPMAFQGSTGNCTLTDGLRLSCPAPVTFVQATLGNGNDIFDASKATTTSVYVSGGPGSDTIWGGAAGDSLHGGSGQDVIYGGPGNDMLFGDEDTDRVYGGDGDDTMVEVDDLGQRTDRLYGEGGNDRIGFGLFMYGGDGDDTFLADPAIASSINGQAGWDTIDFSLWKQPVQVSLDGQYNDGVIAPGEVVGPLGANTTTATHGKFNVMPDVEKVIGTKYDDTIIGNDGPNDVYAGDGNDQVQTLGGNDYVHVQGGTKQFIYAGAGTDACRGSGDVLKSGCES